MFRDIGRKLTVTALLGALALTGVACEQDEGGENDDLSGQAATTLER